MVQGTSKGLVKGKSTAVRHAAKAAANSKKGHRYIAPKKAGLMKTAALHQGLSAKINRSVEAQVAAAASSGKLTIMKNVAAEAFAKQEKTKAAKKK
ncbi:hypothetical protein EUX98_g7158 [Antrodiella citrinella]|uniref:Uncharacterized protein n=1 Tax=Antrodiella citrinella TaxID=2447956 RepID=A0A4S4MM88_9APHY|nr:hypothetical protein EUX98_g7158 [Antrodiella citrinella]